MMNPDRPKQELNGEENDPRENEGLEQYVDTLTTWSQEERYILKRNLQYLEIRDRLLEVRRIFAEGGRDNDAGILLEDLRSDLRGLAE